MLVLLSSLISRRLLLIALVATTRTLTSRFHAHIQGLLFVRHILICLSFVCKYVHTQYSHTCSYTNPFHEENEDLIIIQTNSKLKRTPERNGRKMPSGSALCTL